MRESKHESGNLNHVVKFRSMTGFDSPLQNRGSLNLTMVFKSSLCRCTAAPYCQHQQDELFVAQSDSSLPLLVQNGVGLLLLPHRLKLRYLVTKVGGTLELQVF